MNRRWLPSLLLFAVSCGDDPAPLPTLPSGEPTDTGPSDGGLSGDAGFSLDGGSAATDGGVYFTLGCPPNELDDFRLAGSLPTGRESQALTRLGNDLLVLGGWDGTGAINDVLAADLQDPTSWQSTATPLPAPREHLGVFLTDEALCVVGGDDGNQVSDAVYCAARSASGAAGLSATWDVEAALPAPRSAHETIRVGDHVYVLGGTAALQGANQATVFRTALDANGRPTSWESEALLPAGLNFAAVASDQRRLFLISGFAGAGQASQSIIAAEINADGSLEPWREVGRMSDARVGATAHVWDGHLWIIGGLGRNGEVATVEGWPIEPGGTLGAPVPGPRLPAPRFGHASLTFVARLFVVGGWEDTTMLPRDSVLEANCR